MKNCYQSAWATRLTLTTVSFLVILSTVFAAGAPAPTAQTAKYRIDAGSSRFMVKAFAGGLLSAVAGHDHNIAIKDFGGAAQFTYGSFEPASLELNVKASSLTVTDKVSDDDRRKIESTMRDEVLEVQKYPEIVFKSTAVSASKVDEGKYNARITGELSLHGQTRQVSFPAQIDLSNNSLRARGEISLHQTDYGIKPVSVAGGTVKVKNDVKLTFDIHAR